MKHRILTHLPRPARTALTLASLLLAASGCARIEHAAPAEQPALPISMGATLARPTTPVDSFTDSRKKFYLFWYLLPLSESNLWTIAEANRETADGIVNLTADTSYDLGDVLIFACTAGLVTSWDIDVAGDRVQFAKTATAH